MYDRSTDSVKRALIRAQEHARSLAHGSIGTEHFLLGLASIQPCPATQVLTALEIPPETLLERLLGLLEPGTQTSVDYLPFTPAAGKALQLSLRGALALGSYRFGTEHLLLGIKREGSGPAGRVLAELGVELDDLEREVAALSEPRHPVATPDPPHADPTEPGPE